MSELILDLVDRWARAERQGDVDAYSTEVACTRGPDLVTGLRRLGYRRVRLYAEGIEDWVCAGLPVEVDAT